MVRLFDISAELVYYLIHMARTTNQGLINISKEEYARLKALERRFGVFWKYIQHLKDIEEARRDIGSRKTILQEELFKSLDL